MNYSFSLEWYELNEDLREAKISAFIENQYNNGGYVNPDGEHVAPLDDLLSDPEIHREADSAIASHFPIYF